MKHMLFLKWPDYGIPPCADSFLHFVKSVRDMQAKSVKEMPEWKVNISIIPSNSAVYT